jgi:hypothetical protein
LADIEKGDKKQPKIARFSVISHSATPFGGFANVWQKWLKFAKHW